MELIPVELYISRGKQKTAEGMSAVQARRFTKLSIAVSSKNGAGLCGFPFREGGSKPVAGILVCDPPQLRTGCQVVVFSQATDGTPRPDK